jgi:uncharacterized protein YoxC
MDTMFVTAAMSTPSLVLRYAAAFFFVLVAIFLAYALFKAAKALERADKVLADVDENGIPLMRKAGDTLDSVNANLGNVDEITKDVAGITDKIDRMTGSVEGAVRAPARKAAAFSAGVQSAVSNFRKRDKTGDAASGATGGWSYDDAAAEPSADADVATPAAEAAADAADTVGDATSTAASGAADAAAAAGDAAGVTASGAADAATAAGEAVADSAADAKPAEA